MLLLQLLKKCNETWAMELVQWNENFAYGRLHKSNLFYYIFIKVWLWWKYILTLTWDHIGRIFKTSLLDLQLWFFFFQEMFIDVEYNKYRILYNRIKVYLILTSLYAQSLPLPHQYIDRQWDKKWMRNEMRWDRYVLAIIYVMISMSSIGSLRYTCFSKSSYIKIIPIVKYTF